MAISHSANAQLLDERISLRDTAQSPGIVMLGSDLFVSWQAIEASGPGGRFGMREWRPGSIPSDSGVVALATPPLKYWLDTYHQLSSYVERDYLVHCDGASQANSTRSLVIKEYTRAGNSWPEVTSSVVKYVVTRSGWTPWFEDLHQTLDFMPNNPIATTDGFDPNRREIVSFVGRLAIGPSLRYQLATVTSCDTSGAIRWSVQAGFAPVSDAPIPIPVGTIEFILLYDRHARHYRGARVVDSFDLPTLQSRTQYRRLYGDRFLRTYPDSSRHSLTLELYTLAGELRGRRVLHFPMEVLGNAIVQRREDSSLVLVWGSDSGVNALRLEPRTLAVGARHWRIGAYGRRAVNPWAVLRNDTLYAVWTDLRDGFSSVYGTCRPLPSVSVWEENEEIGDVECEAQTSSTVGAVISTIWPQPARGMINVRVSLPHGTHITLDLCDMLGRTVVRGGDAWVPVGKSEMSINVAGLAPGTYFVIVRGSDGIRGVRRCVIVD
jgi:hypothetical protein